MDLANERARRLLGTVGADLRIARRNRGLSQTVVASTASVPQSTLSEVERGLDRAMTIHSLSRIASAVGLELSVRLYPGGEPIRDAAHAKLLARFRQAVGERIWRWAAEVPLPIAGDKRAWDRMLSGAGIRIGIEAETRPIDMQELQRRLALKKRDGRVNRLILVLPDTRWCRQLVRFNDLETTFAVPGSVALKALSEGRDPGGDAFVLI